MKFTLAQWKYASILTIVFVLGYVTHILIATISPTPTSAAVQVEPSLRESGKYALTSPLLLCATYESTDTGQTKSLQSEVQSLIDSEIRSGRATDVSVYLRGFKGKWVGVNENQQYVPASLLKVPLMIVYFKQAEDDPAILDKILTYDGSYDDNQAQEFRSLSDIKPGKYKAIDLIKSMIVNSDNNATRLLNANISKSALASVYTDLGLTLPDTKGTDVAVISAKQYSYFFRILYNSTYLSPEYSEKALEFLAGPDFPQGLRSTVPVGVKVAEKFGERSVFTPSGDIIERNLHDCGIIYAPTGPYMLCVMTKGKSFQDLATVIQDIGEFVYSKSTEVSR